MAWNGRGVGQDIIEHMPCMRVCAAHIWSMRCQTSYVRFVEQSCVTRNDLKKPSVTPPDSSLSSLAFFFSRTSKDQACAFKVLIFVQEEAYRASRCVRCVELLDGAHGSALGRDARPSGDGYSILASETVERRSSVPRFDVQVSTRIARS